MGQRLIDHGYISRVSRELKAQQVNHFGHSERAKSEFRSGGSFYRFDDVRISPFQVRWYGTDINVAHKYVFNVPVSFSR